MWHLGWKGLWENLEVDIFNPSYCTTLFFARLPKVRRESPRLPSVQGRTMFHRHRHRQSLPRVPRRIQPGVVPTWTTVTSGALLPKELPPPISCLGCRQSLSIRRLWPPKPSRNCLMLTELPGLQLQLRIRWWPQLWLHQCLLRWVETIFVTWRTLNKLWLRCTELFPLTCLTLDNARSCDILMTFFLLFLRKPILQFVLFFILLILFGNSVPCIICILLFTTNSIFWKKVLWIWSWKGIQLNSVCTNVMTNP